MHGTSVPAPAPTGRRGGCVSDADGTPGCSSVTISSRLLLLRRGTRSFFLQEGAGILGAECGRGLGILTAGLRLLGQAHSYSPAVREVLGKAEPAVPSCRAAPALL